ncbi:M23 family metallopeptidase [Nitratifractor sp.]
MRRRNYYGSRRRRRGGGGWILFLLFLLIAGGVAGYVWYSPKFERIAPSVELPGTRYWNPKKAIEIRVRDNHALGNYRVFLTDGVKRIRLASGTFVEGLKEARIPVTISEKVELDPRRTPWTLQVEVTDRSLWNFGKGNRSFATSKILVDRTPPVLGVLAKSPSIVRGGSALLIFQARDAHLKSVKVHAGGRNWIPIPYKEKGSYVTLLAWPFRNPGFRVEIVAEDLAGNRSVLRVPFETINRKYRQSWIQLSDRFLNGKIAEIASQYPEIAKIHDPLKRFKAVNEDLRKKNEALIHRYSSKVSPVDFDRWRLKAFYPLKHAKRVADFGTERHYYYKDRTVEVSRSYHMGYDLASTRNAPIFSSNSGTVVFASYNGIYGNMPIIDHGLGLYTLYGHCSSLLVAKGDRVRAEEIIAKTGKTGLALGDHLHFGMLVQGTEVLPMDWMKANWIKSHIDQVFKRADRIIASQKGSR